MRIVAAVLLFFYVTSGSAQQNIDEIEKQLFFYGDVMVNAMEPINRIQAGETFYDLFSDYLEATNVFNSALEQFKTISVLAAEDKSFKLISWQLEREERHAMYFGYVIFPDGKYVELKDNNELSKSSANLTIIPEEWYGALYYNLMPLDKNKYLVFGYNSDDTFENKKLADVLTVQDRNVSFGDDLFEDALNPGLYNNRIVLTYASDASVNLNYNPGMKMIVFDHLIARMGKLPGQGPTFIPDGTYEGFKWHEGKWQYVEKLFNHSYGDNNAPRPKPVIDKKKNILGN
jgi:hypothetical protein